MDGVLLVDKPAGKTSHDVVARGRAASSARGRRSATPARSTRSRPGCCSSCVGRATRVQRFLMALPKTYETVARLRRGLDDRRPARARSPRPARVPPDPLALPTGTLAPAPAGLQRGQGRRRARLRAGAARGGGRAARARGRRSTRFEQLWREGDRAAFAIDCSSGTYVRSLIADLGDAYCEELRRTRDRPVRASTTPTPSARRAARRALAVPAASCALDGEDARRAGARRRAGRRPRPRRATVLLVDADGPIAIAEPREGARAQAHRRLPRDEDHPPARRRAAARAASPSARSTASTSATARSSRGADTVLTFDPHPLSVVAPGARAAAAHDARAQGRARRGARASRSSSSSRSTARSPRAAPQEFVDDVLVETLGADARRAWARTSASATRRRATPRCCAPTTRFETRVVPLLEVDGEVVSSSHIRGLVLGGAVEYAGQLLGAPFALDRRGRPRRQARPRARLPDREPRARPTATSCPGHGVYACRVRVGRRRRRRRGQRRRAAEFETGRGELIEAYLIDFDGDLYGQTLRIEFLKRLRGERRFDSRRRAGRADGPRRRARRAAFAG